MKEKVKFEGIYCPIVTPFRNSSIDIAGLKENIAILNISRISGIVPLGTSGEFSSLTKIEKIRLMETVMEVSSKPVIAGASYTNIGDTLEFIELASDIGAVGALIAPPYYLISNEKGLYNYYKSINDASKLPILLYNIPSLTKNPLTPELVAILAKFDNIVGIKDTSGNLRNFITYTSIVKDPFSFLIGNEALLLPALIFGASGGILGASNFNPELLVSIYEDHLNLEESVRLQRILNYSIDIFDIGTFPANLKYAMDVVGLYGGEVRPPAAPLTDEEMEKIEGLVEKIMDEKI